mgnify:FL=1
MQDTNENRPVEELSEEEHLEAQRALMELKASLDNIQASLLGEIPNKPDADDYPDISESNDYCRALVDWLENADYSMIRCTSATAFQFQWVVNIIQFSPREDCAPIRAELLNWLRSSAAKTGSDYPVGPAAMTLCILYYDDNEDHSALETISGRNLTAIIYGYKAYLLNATDHETLRRYFDCIDEFEEYIVTTPSMYGFNDNLAFPHDHTIAELLSLHPEAATVYKEQSIGRHEKPQSSAPAPQAQQKSGCYIATAVYGSYDAPEVMTLRRFRDEVLAQSFFGRLFIKIYYALSPPVAERLKDMRRLNAFIRSILNKWVAHLEKEQL